MILQARKPDLQSCTQINIPRPSLKSISCLPSDLVIKSGMSRKSANRVFTPYHHEILAQMRYEQDSLLFPDDRWQGRYLGRGEEKAVFCVCDHEQRVFALELIDERHYLNGRCDRRYVIVCVLGRGISTVL